ncbi:hypothetical protein BY458DRAFT_493943 [Sporodiniella umbellata]|nr:hypothetical protein BY458DRAFT_493943 [Sporodiniella umbellata]
MPSTTLKEWESKLQKGLPVILMFAIIGMAASLAGLAYFAYRRYRGRHRRDTDKETAKKDEESSAVPCLAISSPTRQSNFKPINTSLHLVPREEIMCDPARRHGVDELQLWERKQQNNNQYWKFLSTDYPDSPESVKTRITRSLSEDFKVAQPITMIHTAPSSSNDISLVRQALQDSRLKNSSSEWLHFSGSKSF